MGPMVTEHQSYLASFLWMRVILNNEASAEWVLGTVQSVVSFSRSISSWNRSFGDHSFLLPSRRREGLQTSSDLDLYSSWLHWERNSWVHTQGEECRSHCWNGVWLQFYRQYLDHSMLRSVTAKCPGAINKIVEIFAKDVRSLALDGICSSDGSMKIHMVHLNTKGDLPALAKLGGLTRTFSHVPRASASRNASAGICHLCLGGQESNGADQEAYPYEDFSVHPRWMDTIEKVEPWRVTPPILEGVLIDRSHVAHFFSPDIWHNVHLGAGKHWIANSFVGAVERLSIWEGTSVEAKFQQLTDGFKEFCHQHHISPHMDEISRATMGFPQSSSCPIGQWSKGAVTTHFMKYLEWFCDVHKDAIKNDDMMSAIATCCFV